ncbi:hypothetical protein ACJBU6_00657 [Exserohilum turcicum]
MGISYAFFVRTKAGGYCRTHRERKEAYTASLESEVVRLRATKARLETEAKALFAENTALKQYLNQHGIAVPIGLTRDQHVIPNNSSNGSPGYSSYSSSASPPSSSDTAPDDTLVLSVTQEDSTSKKRNWRKQVFVHQTCQTYQTKSSSPQSIRAPFVSPPSSGSATPNNSISTTITKASLGSLDPEIVGMDFVLTLESPCLSHIDVPPTSPLLSSDTSSSLSSPPTSASTGTFSPLNTGHALTLSACVLHNHPSPPGQRQHSHQPWRVPRASLEQLLALSAAIPLGDTEVTPVQAWEYVRRQQGFADLEVARWEALKEKLVEGIKCHGFGGVVERQLLENSVFEAFVVGKVF